MTGSDVVFLEDQSFELRYDAQLKHVLDVLVTLRQDVEHEFQCRKQDILIHAVQHVHDVCGGV